MCARAGLLRNRLRSFKSGVLAAVFLPFGPFVCVGSLDKSAAVFHILTGEIKFALAAHASAITALAVSDDGILLTASSDADLRVWDLRMPWPDEMGTQLACCEGAHTGAVSSCRLTDDGNAMISASEDSTLVVWDALKGLALRYLSGHTGPVASFLLLQHQGSSTHSPVATRSSRITGPLKFIVSASQDGSIRVWDITTGLDQCFLRLGAALTCLAKSRDECTLAAGDVDGRVHLLSLCLPGEAKGGGESGAGAGAEVGASE
jgi:WD40 repeat protein